VGRIDIRPLVRRVRQLTRALSDVREVDVVTAWIEADAPRSPWTPDAVERVLGVCAAAREAAVRNARSRLDHQSAVDLAAEARAVADRAEALATSARATSVITAEVSRRARQLAALRALAGTTYGVESLHQVRLGAKKLRYTLEAASGLPGAPAGNVRRELKHLQNLLGQIHDAQAVQRYVRIAAGAPDVPRSMVTTLAEIDRALETRCRRWHARIVASRPDLDATLVGIRRSVAGRISPRQVGRMVRMDSDRKRRRRAARA
jgi:CHAD domain-containing protein